jgi:hypothetical protein
MIKRARIIKAIEEKKNNDASSFQKPLVRFFWFQA